MSVLTPAPHHHTGEFNWDPATRTFSAASSDLRWPIGWPRLGRVFDDAIDEGFTLFSDRTGKEVAVAIERVDEDPDYSGGWRAIEFVPAERSRRGQFKVVVLND